MSDPEFSDSEITQSSGYTSSSFDPSSDSEIIEFELDYDSFETTASYLTSEYEPSEAGSTIERSGLNPFEFTTRIDDAVDRYEHQTWESVKRQIKPLDFIGFHGRGISKVIKVFEKLIEGNGDITHCGIVVTRKLFPKLKQLRKGRLYVLEATMSKYVGPLNKDDTPDVVSGKGKFGVQIRDLELLVKAYTSSGSFVGWAGLSGDPWDDKKKRAKFVKDFRNLPHVIGKSYELNFYELAGSIFFPKRAREIKKGLKKMIKQIDVDIDGVHQIPALRNFGLSNYKTTQWFFCSELTAFIYLALGLISDDVDPTNIVPVNFLGHGADGLINLLKPMVILDPTK